MGAAWSLTPCRGGSLNLAHGGKQLLLLQLHVDLDMVMNQMSDAIVCCKPPEMVMMRLNLSARWIEILFLGLAWFLKRKHRETEWLEKFD